jgi:hypothetical protein
MERFRSINPESLNSFVGRIPSAISGDNEACARFVTGFSTQVRRYSAQPEQTSSGLKSNSSSEENRKRHVINLNGFEGWLNGKYYRRHR